MAGDVISCNNTKENFLWVPEKINVKFHKMTSYTWNFQNFTCVFTILVKFDIYFSGLPCEVVIGVITDNKSHLSKLACACSRLRIFLLYVQLCRHCIIDQVWGQDGWILADFFDLNFMLVKKEWDQHTAIKPNKLGHLRFKFIKNTFDTSCRLLCRQGSIIDPCRQSSLQLIEEGLGKVKKS